MSNERRISHVSADAEGVAVLKDGRTFAYDTRIVSRDGCAVHFWLGDTPADEVMPELKRLARNMLDVVEFTSCPGEPTGFWGKARMDAMS